MERVLALETNLSSKLPLSLESCVTLDKVFNLSELILLRQNEDISIHLRQS